MIGQIDIEKSLLNAPNDRSLFVAVASVVNSLVDAVNELHEEAKNNARIRANHGTLIESCIRQNNIHEKQIDELQMKAEPEKCKTPTENVQPDYVATAYMTDGHTKEYYGQNGASVVTDRPLPAGYVIAINEPETKGGDNE